MILFSGLCHLLFIISHDCSEFQGTFIVKKIEQADFRCFYKFFILSKLSIAQNYTASHTRRGKLQSSQFSFTDFVNVKKTDKQNGTLLRSPILKQKFKYMTILKFEPRIRQNGKSIRDIHKPISSSCNLYAFS